MSEEIRKGNVKELYKLLIDSTKKVAGTKTVAFGMSKPFWNSTCTEVFEAWRDANLKYQEDKDNDEKKQERDHLRRTCRKTIRKFKKEFYDSRIVKICNESAEIPHKMFKLLPKARREDIEELEDETGQICTNTEDVESCQNTVFKPGERKRTS